MSVVIACFCVTYLFVTLLMMVHLLSLFIAPC